MHFCDTKNDYINKFLPNKYGQMDARKWAMRSTVTLFGSDLMSALLHSKEW